MQKNQEKNKEQSVKKDSRLSSLKDAFEKESQIKIDTEIESEFEIYLQNPICCICGSPGCDYVCDTSEHDTYQKRGFTEGSKKGKK